MTILELIQELKKFNPDEKVMVSSDEELNTLYNDIEVALLEGQGKVVIYGLSGSEDYE